jgi:transglutaminase-like putative cysteine protease
VPAIIAGLVLLNFHAADNDLVLGRRELRRLLPVCLALPAATFPLLLFLFAILPRTAFPLWQSVNPTAAAAAFTETVRPGAFAGLAANAAVAFRADGRELPQSELYWRGIVLNTLDGHTWVRRRPPASEATRVREGLSVRQTIYPEPRPGGYLPALDLPLHLQGVFSRGEPDLVHASRGGGRRVHYEAFSSVNGALEVVSRIDRAFYLQVPAASARVRQAAAAIAEGRDDREKIARLEAFLRERRLAYATDDLPGPEDPVDGFLFEKRRGYCEFFASASAVLLRLAGVPTRLVGGYLGGEYSAFGGYYTVTEEMAHVWLEALVDGREWVRLDPSRLAADAPSTLLAARERGRPLGRTLADALDYYWTRAVLTYDLERQLSIVRGVDLPPGTPISGRRLLWLAAPLTAIGAFFLLRHWKRPEDRLLRAFLRRIGKNYHLPPLSPGTGLHDLAGRLPDPRCREFVEIWEGAVFRDRPLTAAERRQLRRLLRGMAKGDVPAGTARERG